MDKPLPEGSTNEKPRPVVGRGKAISEEEVEALRSEFDCLKGLKIDWLALPPESLEGFEPSQIAVIVNTLLDAAMPQMTLLASDDKENALKIKELGLSKAPRSIGERESYPDYIHKSGKRVELKGLFVDNAELNMKRPPTQREASARLKENVTIDVIDPANDVLLIAAVQMKLVDGMCYPVIVDIGVFSMAECIEARDKRLADAGGRWFGRMPKVISTSGRAKVKAGADISSLSEVDFEKDTNFGKLKRIPYPPLQEFMHKYGIALD